MSPRFGLACLLLGAACVPEPRFPRGPSAAAGQVGLPRPPPSSGEEPRIGGEGPLLPAADAAPPLVADAAPASPPAPDAGAGEAAMARVSADASPAADAGAALFEGTFSMVSTPSNACLAVVGDGDSASVQQAACSASDRQYFLVESVGGGLHHLVNVNKSKCLEVDPNASGDPLPVRLWRCDSTPEQRYRIDTA